MINKQTWVCGQCQHCYTKESTTCPECGCLLASKVPESLIEQYKDRLAPFLLLMARKMAASEIKGRLGWVQCSQQDLSNMLREHVEKGDPVDVANFCFMLSDVKSGILPITGNHWPCWACSKPVSMNQRANSDGHCPHCEVELDIENWPFNEKTIRELRESGHAVIVWTPEEIGEADIDDLESLSIERGHNYLDEFKEIEDDE